jgi:hypothetical protein
MWPAYSHSILVVTAGVKDDAGGLAFVRGVPVPVDPLGWLTIGQVDAVFTRATKIVEQQFRNDPKMVQLAIASLLEFRLRFSSGAVGSLKPAKGIAGRKTPRRRETI